MELNRRRLVQSALFATLWPAVWAGTSGSRLWTPLDQARREAIASGEPLLVLLVPSDPASPELEREVERERERRGALFGAVLNHGSERTLAALGACRAVCAEPAEVERAFPRAGALPPEAWFVWICGDEVRLGTVVLSPSPGWLSIDDAFQQEMEQLEAALVAVLGEPPAGSASALAERARERWVDGEVPGSQWLSFRGGCLASYRPERVGPLDRLGRIARGLSHAGAMCGMAHVPGLAARMLEFY